MAGGLTLSAFSIAPASAAAPQGDPELVAGLLSVELLSISVVDHVLAGGHLPPRAERLARRILRHEQTHAAQIRQERGPVGSGTPPAPRTAAETDAQLAAHHTDRRLGDVHDERGALDLLLAMESIAEGALYDAMSKLAAPALQTLAARLLACEAQHEAALGALREPKDADQSTPYAFVEGIH